MHTSNDFTWISLCFFIITICAIGQSLPAADFFRPGDALFVVDIQNDFMEETPITNVTPRYPIPEYAKTAGGTKIRAGAIATPASAGIIQPVNRLVGIFNQLSLPVFFSLDWHPPDHCSFCRNGTQDTNPEYYHPHGAFCPIHPDTPFVGLDKRCMDARTTEDFNSKAGAEQWPDHCIQTTWGSRFHPYLNVPNNSIVIKKAFVKTLDSYSAVQGGVLSRQGEPFDTEDTETELAGQLGLVEILKGAWVRRLFVVGIATDYCVKSTAVDVVRTGLVGDVVVVLPLTRWVGSLSLELAMLTMIANNVTIISEDPSIYHLENQ